MHTKFTLPHPLKFFRYHSEPTHNMLLPTKPLCIGPVHVNALAQNSFPHMSANILDTRFVQHPRSATTHSLLRCTILGFATFLIYHTPLDVHATYLVTTIYAFPIFMTHTSITTCATCKHKPILSNILLRIGGTEQANSSYIKPFPPPHRWHRTS